MSFQTITFNNTGNLPGQCLIHCPTNLIISLGLSITPSYYLLVEAALPEMGIKVPQRSVYGKRLDLPRLPLAMVLMVLVATQSVRFKAAVTSAGTSPTQHEPLIVLQSTASTGVADKPHVLSLSATSTAILAYWLLWRGPPADFGIQCKRNQSGWLVATLATLHTKPHGHVTTSHAYSPY